MLTAIIIISILLVLGILYLLFLSSEVWIPSLKVFLTSLGQHTGNACSRIHKWYNTPREKKPMKPVEDTPKGQISGLSDNCILALIILFFCIFPPLSILLIVIWIVESIRRK